MGFMFYLIRQNEYFFDNASIILSGSLKGKFINIDKTEQLYFDFAYAK